MFIIIVYFMYRVYLIAILVSLDDATLVSIRSSIEPPSAGAACILWNLGALFTLWSFS